MRVNGLDSANAGAQESESKSPAFQIIVLVRSYNYVYSIILPTYLCLTNVSAPFLQSPLSTVLVWTLLYYTWLPYGPIPKSLLLCLAFVL